MIPKVLKGTNNMFCNFVTIGTNVTREFHISVGTLPLANKRLNSDIQSKTIILAPNCSMLSTYSLVKSLKDSWEEVAFSQFFLNISKTIWLSAKVPRTEDRSNL